MTNAKCLWKWNNYLTIKYARITPLRKRLNDEGQCHNEEGNEDQEHL